MSATSFTFEPVFLALAGAAALAYAWAARKERPPPRRIALFAIGLVLIAASLNSPLETIAAKRLLLVHLLQNALIADIAPPFLGLALIFSSRPFYSFYEHTQRLWGLSPIRDQNLGGIVMNGEQTLVFLLAIGWYVWRLLAEEHAGAAGETRVAR